MAITISVDGTDLSGLGLAVAEDISGWRSRPVSDWPTAQVPGRWGETLLSSAPRIGPRVLEVPCILTASSASNLQSNLNDINWHLDAGRVGEMLVKLSTDTALEFRARAADVDDSLVNAAVATTAAELTISFFCPDPRIYTNAASVVSFNSATAMPQGTAPTEPVIRVEGAALGSSDPTVIYKDTSGTEQARLEFTHTFADDTEHIDVDMATGEITDEGGNNVASSLTGGSFFRLDPQDGDFPNSSWPTLEVDTGSGQATYERAFLAGR